MPWYRPRRFGSSRGGRSSTITSTLSMRSSTHSGSESSASPTSSSKRARSITSGPLLGERADRLQDDAVREHRRDLALVVRGRDLDDVHPHEADPPDDPPHRAEQLAREHASRLGGPGPRRPAGIYHLHLHPHIHA